MTKSEFIVARRRCQREISCLGFAWLALWMGAFLGVAGVFSDWLHKHNVVFFLFIVIALFGFVVPMVLLCKFLHRKHKLVCPACNCWLINARSVVNTGRCPKCRSEVFYDA